MDTVKRDQFGLDVRRLLRRFGEDLTDVRPQDFFDRFRWRLPERSRDLGQVLDFWDPPGEIRPGELSGQRCGLRLLVDQRLLGLAEVLQPRRRLAGGRRRPGLDPQ